jgi:DNA polymerase V
MNALIKNKKGVVGTRILQELRGVSCYSLEHCRLAKEITVSRSFQLPIESPDELKEAIAAYASRGS